MQPNISDHITYAESIYSATGERQKIANVPTEAILANMRITAKMIFEPLREALGPIRVVSFFRCPALNKAVGGASNSQHIVGEAMDLQGIQVSNAELFHYIKKHLPFDQMIWEFGTSLNPDWVHVSYSSRNRRQALRAVKVKGKTEYHSF
jgi:zinc D-Ala-D-Ala carboxypeptidase